MSQYYLTARISMALEQLPYFRSSSAILELQGFAGGYVGVDIFFVISGYLMGRLAV